ncbi:MAG: signal peptidase II, partial [Myxococcota bacterium]
RRRGIRFAMEDLWEGWMPTWSLTRPSRDPYNTRRSWVQEVTVSPKAKKLLLFGAVFAVWLVADLWSKHWADTTLADARHPQAHTVAEADAGKTLGEVAGATWGWDADEANRRIPNDVERLAPAGGYAATDRPFAVDSPAASARAFYVFWRGHDAPPRRFERTRDRLQVERWLRMALPETPSTEIKAATQTTLGAMSFGQWISHHFPKLDPQEVAAFSSTAIYPIAGARTTMSSAVVVKPGETYLLTRHRIDVMGDWFKFVYAENEGAAFGFLKTASFSTRTILFGLLTILALLVVLVIVWRLPPTGWFVYVAFAGILSGAAGNFVDRVRYGYVIDFIDMDLGFMHWPTYNVADIAILVGVVALIVDITFNKNSPLVSQKDKERRDERIAAKAAKKKARSGASGR